LDLKKEEEEKPKPFVFLRAVWSDFGQPLDAAL